MDNLLFLSHYFGMCELLHWCPPPPHPLSLGILELRKNSAGSNFPRSDFTTVL